MLGVRSLRTSDQPYRRFFVAACVLLLALATACAETSEPVSREADSIQREATPTITPSPDATVTPLPTPALTPTIETEDQHDDSSEATATSQMELPVRLFKVQVSTDGSVGSVAFAPDGETVAGGTHREVQILRVPDGELVRSIEFNHWVEELDFSPDGVHIAGGTGLGGVFIKQTDDGTTYRRLESGLNSKVAYSPDGQSIITGNRSGGVWLRDSSSGDLLWEAASSDRSWIGALAFAPDGARVAAGYGSGNVDVWNVVTGEIEFHLANPERIGPAVDLSWSADGTLLAVAGAREDFQNVVRIWNTTDGAEHGIIATGATARSAVFSPDAVLLAIGTSNGISLWQVDDLTRVSSPEWDAPPGGSDWITDLAFSPDSTLLVASRRSGYVELWQVQLPHALE